MASKSDFLSGIWTAIATPFTDAEEIDWQSYGKIIAEQIEGGVTGIVVSGTTGEAPTLTNKEKIELVKRTKKLGGKKLRVMAGTGGNDTKSSVELSKEAIDTGADALLIVTPPYNKPNLAGLKRHYEAIGKAAGSTPICLYHVPGRTAQKLSPEALAELCEIKNVVSIKEASADLQLFSKAKILSRKTRFLSGDDFTYLPSLSVGGEGCVSVISNVYPGAMVQLTEAFLKKDAAGALRIHEALFEAMELLFCETNPCPLKAFLNAKKLCKNVLRAPLAPVSSKNFASIKECVSTTDKRLAEVL